MNKYKIWSFYGLVKKQPLFFWGGGGAIACVLGRGPHLLDFGEGGGGNLRVLTIRVGGDTQRQDWAMWEQYDKV